jgi:hypothetical protein
MEIGSSSHKFNHHRFIVVLSSTTLKLQGFFDALAYSATPQVLKRWQQFLSDTFIPSFEWSNFSNQTSSLIGGAVNSSKPTGPPNSPLGPNDRRNKQNPLSSNSNSKGSSYFSYAREESREF